MKKIPSNNMSAFIRKMALNWYIVFLDLSDVKETVRLLRINSNNLNQYAHKANSTGKVYQEDIEKLKKQHEEIWDVLNDIPMRLSNILAEVGCKIILSCGRLFCVMEVFMATTKLIAMHHNRGLTQNYDEKELKDALMQNVQALLMELGRGFAFVGREYRLVVGKTEQFIDLL